MAYEWLIPIAGVLLWEEQQVKHTQEMQPKSPQGLFRLDKEHRYQTDAFLADETPCACQQDYPL